MSRLHWLIVLSLAINLVLAIHWWQWSVAPESGAIVTLDAPSAAPDAEVRAPATEADGAGSTSGPMPSVDDLAAVHRHLVAAGYPRPLIVRIISTLAHRQVSAWFQAQRASAGSPHEYWKPMGGGVRSGTPAMVEMLKLQRQVAQQLVDLLGPTYLDDLPARASSLRHRYGALSAEKLLRLEALELSLDQERYGPIPAGSTETDEERERRVHDEHRAAVAAVLTPSELLEYELRSSRTADSIRRDYAAANLSEEEYRRLFAFFRPLEPQLGSALALPHDAAARTARQQAEAVLLEQMKATFGAARAAELALVRDPTARQERELTARLGLPLSAAGELVSIRNDIEGRVKAIHEARNLTLEQRRARTNELLTEAERRFTATLGTDGFSQYRKFGGQWMQRLSDH